MIDFEFYNPTRIIFGRNSYEKIGKEVSAYSNKILLHYGGKSIKKNGIYDQVVAELEKAGIRFFELGGVMPNPRLSLVEQGIDICRRENIDFILAVGGGSVIDSAKAIASGVHYDGSVWDFYTSSKRPERVLDIGVVLTIPAAGSESSDGSVITNEAGPDKKSFTSPKLYPKFSILNPQACTTIPAYQIAVGGADILAHVMERYFTCTENTDLSDRLCEGAMLALLQNLPMVKENKEDITAWEEVLWTGNVAHNSLLGKGRQEDWACHAIEHEVSAIYDIAHGAGLAILFPAWMKYVYKSNVKRFVQFAIRVFQVNMPYENQEDIALEGIKRLEEFFQSLGLFTRFSQVGIGDSDFNIIAEKACGDWELGALKRLAKNDVLEILKLAK